MALDDPEVTDLTAKGHTNRRILLRTGPRLAQVAVAAVDGQYVDGGVVLASCSDLRVCGESTTFLIPKTERGMTMSCGSVL